MSERQKDSRFLKTLILCDDSEYGRRLQERVQTAEKDERCIRCAVYLVALMVLLSMAGLGYSAVFVPEIARFSSHLVPRILCAFGLGSLICLLIFVGYWLWYRALSNKTYEECRRFLGAALEGRMQLSAQPSAAPKRG